MHCEQKWLIRATGLLEQMDTFFKKALKYTVCQWLLLFYLIICFIYIMVTISPNVLRAPKDKSRGVQLKKNDYWKLLMCVCMLVWKVFHFLPLTQGTFLKLVLMNGSHDNFWQRTFGS